jgi:AraC-like DNA-binding protein
MGLQMSRAMWKMACDRNMTDESDARIATAHFDGASVPPEQRLAAWGELTPGYDAVLPPGARADEFEVVCRGWLLDDLVVTHNQVGAIEIVRTPAHIMHYRRDTYTFILLTRGRWWAELDYGTINVGSGQVCIMDFRVPWHVHGAAQENIMLVVPRTLIEAAVPNAPRLHGRLLEGASGRLFAEHMVALSRHLADMRLRDVPLVREATLGLLVGAVAALSPEQPGARLRATRTTSAARIKDFIDGHLTDPDLGVARICRDLAVTRPTLYRALRDIGGVANYIQRRRLEAAHARLSDPEEARTLAELADQYCFSSPAHFSTAFRRRFGYAPRSAKGAPMRPADASGLFQRWVSVLGDP